MISLLLLAAFGAGVVDAIAGGGGLITVPALLTSGLDPQVALATNKGQAVFGSSASFLRFLRHGQVDRRRAPWSFAAATLGSVLGARLVLALDPAVLRPLVLLLLLLASALALVSKPEASTRARWVERVPRLAAVVIALLLGAYDGFFGPGTGTFLLLAYAYTFGDDLVSASGNAKVANFASNLAAFAAFAASGVIRWELALPMGAAQVAGAWVGTELAVHRGARLVRAVAVTISLALAARVLWQMLRS
ncbi:MAG: TSUP family transporter [Myxococcales bacterium]|nr:TSUP family transporter [Polyangiaceae bacterium]MDW8250248.1 TSUP family transporter [Myxococcales bacterium]